MSELLTYLQSNEPQFRKARLAALYSDFRQLQTLNPDGYTANISAWLKGLTSATLAGVTPSSSSTPNHLILNVDQELLRALDTKEWGRPLALGTVIREAINKREWMGLKEFEVTEGVHVKKGGWGISPWGLVGWGFKLLGLGGGVSGEDKLPVGKFVIIANLDEAAWEFARRVEGIRSRADRVFPRVELRQRYGDLLGEDKTLSESDFEVLLRYLERDKGLLVHDKETVKLTAPGDKKVITEEDTTIVSLKTLIKDLDIQTQVLTKKVDELNLTAKEAVVRKNRVAALSALRSKKLAETTLTKRHATLAQLEEVFNKIEQAADQVDLVRIMEASTHALSVFNKQVGGVERVDDVVDQLREQMGQVDEVGNVIAEVGKDAVAVDETEVDDELEAMERQEREKVEAKERQEREAKEEKESAKTKERLDALEEMEKVARETESKDSEMDADLERDLEDSMERIDRMTLESTKIPETG